MIVTFTLNALLHVWQMVRDSTRVVKELETFSSFFFSKFHRSQREICRWKKYGKNGITGGTSQPDK